MTTLHAAERAQASADRGEGEMATAVFGAVPVGVLAAVAPAVRATRLNILGAINRA